MRLTIFLFFTAVIMTSAQDVEIEEEDLEEPYNNEYYNTEEYPNDRRRSIYEEEDEPYERRKREAYDEDVEHIRVKRTCAPCREKRSLEFTRRPRQVRQYEVHEYTDDGFGPSLPPYEDMLAASANHYHSIYAVPGSPSSARYLEAANVKGYKHDHYVDKGGKGHKTSELHKNQYDEAEGKKKKHHDHADHKGDHVEEAHGQKGSKFEEKKGHKKGHKTKGYHNKYHKDEFHKEHKFYDDFHKSGEHHRYGRFNAKHAANESGKKKAHQLDAGHDYIERGKKGHSNKGHTDAAHRGHRAKHGHEEHNHHHEEHGHKGGKEGGSHWGYQKEN